MWLIVAGNFLELGSHTDEAPSRTITLKTTLDQYGIEVFMPLHFFFICA